MSDKSFNQAARFLKNRIMAFVSLPLGSLEKLALQTELRRIGSFEGTTAAPAKAA